MSEIITQEVKEIIEKALVAEIQVSYGDPAPYNAFVAPGERTTAVSASGRVMVGEQAVCDATAMVSKGGVGETDRYLEFISGNRIGDMLYGLVKTATKVQKDNGNVDELCWVITLVMEKNADGEWKVVHRQNTRSKL